MLESLFVGFSQFPPQLRVKSSSPTPSSQCYRFPGKAHCQEKAKAHPGSGLWPIGIGVGRRLQVRLLKGSTLACNPAHTCGSRVNISVKSIYFNRQGPSQDTGAQHFRNTRNTYPCNRPAIAQLVEHLTVECCSNQMVPGSIPGGRIFWTVHTHTQHSA